LAAATRGWAHSPPAFALPQVHFAGLITHNALSRSTRLSADPKPSLALRSALDR